MRATEIRPGMAVRIDGKLAVVVKAEHRTPGNLRAFHQIKMKDVMNGQYIDRRYSSSDDLEVTTLDRRNMEYLYSDSNGHTFMDTETFEQETLSDELMADAKPYLAPNTQTIVLVHDGNPVMIELPASVELKVTETAPGIKGATATNQLKDAELETGLKTRVPPFINIGEVIKVSTTDGSYQSRA